MWVYGQDYALDAVSESRNIEVDEEALAETEQSKVREKLGLVDWERVFDRLELQHEPLLDDDVHRWPQ